MRSLNIYFHGVLRKLTSQCYFHYWFCITSVVFVVSLTDADPTSVFFNSSSFSVSEQNYQMLICIFLVYRM